MIRELTASHYIRGYWASLESIKPTVQLCDELFLSWPDYRKAFLSQSCGYFCNYVVPIEWLISSPSVTSPIGQRIPRWIQTGIRDNYKSTNCWAYLLIFTSHDEDERLDFGSATVTKLKKTLKSSSVRVTHSSSADTLILLNWSVIVLSLFRSLSHTHSHTLSVSPPHSLLSFHPLCAQEWEHFSLMSVQNQHEHFHFNKALINPITDSVINGLCLLSVFMKTTFGKKEGWFAALTIRGSCLCLELLLQWYKPNTKTLKVNKGLKLQIL